MMPLPYLSVARFNGPQAGEFLHAQLSADISALESGDATFACYCSPRGQVIALLLVCRQYEDYLVAASAALLPQILTRLGIFVLRTRVEFSIQPVTAVYGIGPGQDSSDPAVFSPSGSGLKYLLSESAEEVKENTELFRAMEIRNHVTWLGPETTEKFIPQILGYDRIGAVSFSKGCYPGQEIIARTHYLGKVKRVPVLVQLEEEMHVSPAERLELHRKGEWSKGTLIDSAAGDGGGTLCFIIASGEVTTGIDQVRYRDRSYRCATT